jgi:hypothetical protein
MFLRLKNEVHEGMKTIESVQLRILIHPFMFPNVYLKTRR